MDRHVLVPRPETELLAEAGWEFLNQRAKTSPATEPAALDFGTGSGCIAIALCAKTASAGVYALDSSPQALSVARTNAERHGFSNRIRFSEGTTLSALPADLRVDLLISNPPYIPSGEIPKLQPEVRDYEPRQALDGGEDGLKFYRYLSVEAKLCLSREGKIMLEFGDGQAESVRQIFEEQNWIVERVVEDYTRRPRILIAALANAAGT